MNATSEAVDPQLQAVQIELAALRQQCAELAEENRAILSLLGSHLPRKPGRPESLAQFHLSDALAWRAADSSAAFVEREMTGAAVLESREANLAYAAQQISGAGVVLEFGVGSGASLRLWEELLPDRRIVGFDSFEGLPEDWRTGFSAGSFADVERVEFERADLRVGWFEDTLAEFLQELDQPIALLHVDCDLYSSTRTVLEQCVPRLAGGAVIVFDEFLNYPGWQDHEAKAWLECVEQQQLSVSYVSYVPAWEQITVRVGG